MIATDTDSLGLDRLLSSGLLRRARKGLGGSHTVVTYPPLEALQHLDDPSVVEAAIGPCESLNLYVHIAFCEFICAFCHYTKMRSDIDAESSLISAYLDAVGRELEMRRSALAGATVDSLYIGGGTPTVLPTAALISLIERFSGLTGGSARRICVESSPLTLHAPTGRVKLAALVAAGVDRISVGVQTFDDELLRNHRGHSAAELTAALTYLRGRVQTLNIDLIQDLPGQTSASIMADIDWVQEFRPEQVTWYILRTGAGSSWHKSGRVCAPDMPSDFESGRRRLDIIDGMESIGYRSCGGGRFVLGTGSNDYYKAVRHAAAKSLLGFGASAYSHGWGWFFRNSRPGGAKSVIRDYIDAVAADRSPIGVGRRLSEDDCATATLSSAIRDVLPADSFSGDTADAQRVSSLVDRLIACGAAYRDAEAGIRLTRYGRAFEEEIVSLFYGRAIRNELASRGLLWAAPG
ncbi:radical SAM protein [Erythrobacter aureus]|uniref:radical SAM protein n=1 Tax=Erythrobacter aureus TaxID=2182384 RepID=UPI003A948E9A